MPLSAPKPCNHTGCNKLVRGERYCEEHYKAIRKHYDSNRPSATARGYDHRWRKARLVHLSNNPLCVRCKEQGITTAANVVDHIIPHKGNKALFNDTSNWQSLCKRCHDRKTATEDGGGWSHRGRAG